MKITIDSINWGEYRAIYRVVEYRDGCVFKTKFLKYVHKDYQLNKHEVECPLSTQLLNDGTINVEI